MQLQAVLVGVIFCTIASQVEGLRRKQHVKARGSVFCPGNARGAVNVLVKLADKDTGPDPDDTMATVRTDEEGNFSIEGDENEITNIDPRIKIYHDCNDGFKPCQRKWEIEIPDKYINSEEWFELGRVNLDMILESEERDCIH